MKKIALCLKAALLLVLVAGVAFAQDDVKKADDQRDAGGQAVVLKTPDLLGKAVKNRDGEQIGYLDDLVIDTKSGKVAYAIFSNRDAVGLTGKLFAMPLSAFSPADNYRHFVLDAKKDDFTNAEGFDSNRLPTKVDERWAKLGKGTPPSDLKEDSLRRLTSLNGLSVKNNEGVDLGKVQGFAVDTTNGKVVYAAMSYGGVAGVGAKYFAIPWQALDMKSLSLQANDRCFVLNATKGDFENQTGFDRNTWPIKGDERFMKRGDSGKDPK
jgi:sporulation protein YlmC with PRC-barrel domain